MSSIEAAVLAASKMKDFMVLGRLDGGASGDVFLVRSVGSGHPSPHTLYALKALKNYDGESSGTLRNRYEAEFRLFEAIGPHPCIVRHWVTFVDIVPAAILALLPDADRDRIAAEAAASPHGCVKTLFALFDFHPTSLKQWLDAKRVLGPCVLPRSEFVGKAADVLSAYLFLEESGVAHRDTRPANVLVKEDGSVCICDLGRALRLLPACDADPTMTVLVEHDSPGGNIRHTAPEVNAARQAAEEDPSCLPTGTYIPYSGQPAFEVGVLLWEMAVGCHPVEAYPRRLAYSEADVCLLTDGMKTQLAARGYPGEFVVLVGSMVACNPRERPSLRQAAHAFSGMFGRPITQAVVAAEPGPQLPREPAPMASPRGPPAFFNMAAEQSVLANPYFKGMWLGYWPGRSEVPLSEFVEVMKAYMIKHWPTEDAKDLFSSENRVSMMRELESYPPTQQISVVEVHNAVPEAEVLPDTVRRWIEAGSVPPFRCPLPPVGFVGYADQLVELGTHVSGSPDGTVKTVGGPVGCGLSSFLCAFAARCRAEATYAGGILSLDVSADVSEVAGITRLCGVARVRATAKPEEMLLAWARSLTQATLILVDGGQSPLSQWMPLLQRLRAASPAGMLRIVLGSSSDSGEGWDVVLKGVTEAETAVMLQKYGVATPAGVGAIFTAARGLPVEIRMRGKRAQRARGDPGSTCSDLEDAGGVEDVIGSASEAGQALLTALSVFPATFGLYAAAAVSGEEEEDAVVGLLGELEELGLVQRVSEARWKVKVKRPSGTIDVVHPAFKSMIEYFVGLVNEAEQRFNSRASAAGLALFDEERDNLDVLFEVCTRARSQPAEIPALLQLLDFGGVLLARTPLEVALGVWTGLLSCAMSELVRARCLNQLCCVKFRQGEFVEALAAGTEALEIRKAALGPQDLSVAASCNNVGNVLFDQGQLDAAWQRHNEALQIWQAAALAPGHPYVAASLNNIALVMLRQGQLVQALATFHQALTIREALLGAEHPDVATSRSNIANVLCDEGKLDDALVMHHEALVIREAALGRQHPAVAASHNNIASVLLKQGRLDDALERYHTARQIQKVALGPQHPAVAGTLHNIASVLWRKGRVEESLRRYQEALIILQAVLGPRHPGVVTLLNSIAFVSMKQMRLEEALLNYRTALAIQKETLPPGPHLDVATSLNNIAAILCKQGKWKEAEVEYSEVLRIRAAVLGLRHPDVAATRKALKRVTSMVRILPKGKPTQWSQCCVQ